jgi:class 3 adenylate cyclase/tetratricopeptide (TPR) repeat protein
MRCPACGTENRAGVGFCTACGSALETDCPHCGASVEPADRFCGTCGGVLAADTARPEPTANVPGVATSERRLVSVLFADLVGFTAFSENRDPEEVRELLNRYFDRCRTLIEQFGGTVEKFIGDAVMAVWGSPIAHEDDAERAVRAALALTQAVTALGAEVGMPELRARAGVTTGSAAVEIGGENHAMVRGDTVNTASRLQSLAVPGTVLVDDVTRAATEAAIVYEDAGEQRVKGRDEPIRGWTALRVVAGVGGARRSVGLEAPFVGRAEELARIISAFDTTINERRARLISVVGEAGYGKSRLLWEFFKHTDGIETVLLWHQGRSLSYGEGVAYWALAEMVRGRANIAEDEPQESARAKLREAIALYVSDERERQLIEPRLAHLLGLEQRVASDRADLFSGWRLFFERMAAADPVLLVFEDLQWADSGLLDFIDYLLEWTADLPIFILAFGRPELLEARPAWTDPIALRPISDEAMHDLLGALVPGLPDELSQRIRARAEGVPLYAVETVRMLLDRGLLAQSGSTYELTGEIVELDVPETLQALVAARLDGLAPAERSALQDAAVLGTTFTPPAVAALGGRRPEEMEGLLRGLVTKQLLAYDDDERSAERGQYSFLQAMLQGVAYGTLSRQDRKARHLAAARWLQETWGSDAGEIAEVLAAHFLAASQADPDAADAPRIRALARETLAEAGRRAASLALGREARLSYDKAVELAEDDETRSTLLEQAGRAAWLAGEGEQALERLNAAIEIYERDGRNEEVARASSVIAEAYIGADRLDDAVALIERAQTNLAPDGKDRAAAASQLGRLYFLRDEVPQALQATDEALAIAEPLQDWETIAGAMISRATTLFFLDRVEESIGVLKHARDLALEHDLQVGAIRAHNNLALNLMCADRLEDALLEFERGLELARSRGDRPWEQILLSGIMHVLVRLGRWNEVVEIGEQLRSEVPDFSIDIEMFAVLSIIYAARGDVGELDRRGSAVGTGDTSDAQVRRLALVGRTSMALAHGRYAEALEMSRALTEDIDPQVRYYAYAQAFEVAQELGDDEEVERLVGVVEGLPPVIARVDIRGLADRCAGQLAAKRGDADEALERFGTAAEAQRRAGYRFELGITLAGRGEVLAAAGRPAEASEDLREALQIFTDVGVRPMVERVESALEQLVLAGEDLADGVVGEDAADRVGEGLSG